MQHTAVYVRVSTKAQGIEAQMPDLLRWCEHNYISVPPAGWPDEDLAPWSADGVVWYPDKFTGRTMNRPGMSAVLDAIRRRQTKRLVVWRLDRLGRTARGLITLFELCKEHDVALLSLRDGFDLATAAGKLMAQILASIAEFELEIRRERIAGGTQANREKQIRAHELFIKGRSVEFIAVELRVSVDEVRRMLAKPPGKLWYGGRSRGTGMVPGCTEDRVKELLAKGLTVQEVANATGAGKRTVYRRLRALRDRRP